MKNPQHWTIFLTSLKTHESFPRLWPWSAAWHLTGAGYWPTVAIGTVGKRKGSGLNPSSAPLLAVGPLAIYVNYVGLSFLHL